MSVTRGDVWLVQLDQGVTQGSYYYYVPKRRLYATYIHIYGNHTTALHADVLGTIVRWWISVMIKINYADQVSDNYFMFSVQDPKSKEI